MYIKERLGVTTVDVLVLGLGGVVHKEGEKIAEAPYAYPARAMTVVEVQRSAPG